MITNRLRCITINTDASFCPKMKVGGWACYIRSDNLRIKQGGAFHNKVNESGDAETMAICNALYILSNYKLPFVDFLVINTDCKNAIDRIENKTYDPVTQYALQLLKSIRERTGCHVKLTHVKAHTSNQNARSLVNRWCDETAKFYMRKARKERKHTPFL